MQKRLLNNDEWYGLINKCYKSDPVHMVKVHASGELGIEYCIMKEVLDLSSGNVNIFALEDNNEFIGYFGDEWCSPDRWLTGFFIMPEKRKTYKKEVWNTILNHFNCPFKSGLYTRNVPAKKFLLKNGCKLVKEINAPLGFACVFEYDNKENL